eukprot:4232-Rhodomonas_salina.2
MNSGPGDCHGLGSSTNFTTSSSSSSTRKRAQTWDRAATLEQSTAQQRKTERNREEGVQCKREQSPLQEVLQEQDTVSRRAMSSRVITTCVRIGHKHATIIRGHPNRGCLGSGA